MTSHESGAGPREVGLDTSHVPVAVALAGQALTLQWTDATWSAPAATLRAACRCASCQAARLRGEPVEAGDGLTLLDAQPIGHYAIQLRFSDGHDRGVFPWAYLRALAATPI